MSRAVKLFTGLSLLGFLTFMAIMFGVGGFWFSVALLAVIGWAMR